jgi:hypothetical protein
LVKQEELTKLGVTHEELLQKFIDQLKRDFEMSNVLDYLPSINTSTYGDIHSGVCVAIEKIRSHTSLFQQLLYRIDISEKQLSEGMRLTESGRENETVADLIIKRVLQKVILKLVYSK